MYGQNFVEVLYNMCIENDANIAQCSYEIVTDESKENIKNNIEIKEEKLKLTEKEAICKIFSKENVEYTVAWNKLYKTSLFNDIKYPKGKLHEDEATTYKLFYEAKKIVKTNLKLYYYYIRQNSITNKKYTLKRLDFIDELEEQLKFFKDRNEEELYIEAYYRYSRSLIQCYYKCKKNIENSEDVQNNLLNKYKISVKYLINKKISIKRKIIILFGYLFPNLYGRLFVA